jgi:hypothetical protein
VRRETEGVEDYEQGESGSDAIDVNKKVATLRFEGRNYKQEARGSGTLIVTELTAWPTGHCLQMRWSISNSIW